MLDPKGLDTSLFYLINHGLSSPLLDTIMPLITYRPALFVLPVLVLVFIKDRRAALQMLVLSVIALSVADALTNLLKHTIQRPRPFMELKDVITLVGRGRSFSMPSAHASNTVAVATVFLYFLSGIKGRLIKAISSLYVLLVAFLVCLSRIYVGVHYPSDVVAGAILGAGVALSILLLFKHSRTLVQRGRYERIGLLLLFLLSLFRLYYIQMGPLDLSPDEAHYWEWSRRPDLSYYSKGPAIAYLIRAGTLLFGNTEMGIRFPAVVLLLLSSIILYRLGREMAEGLYPPGSKSPALVGILSASLLQIIPLFSAYGVVMTIDSPFIFFWSLSLYLFYRAQKDWPIRRGSVTAWLLLGLVTGLGVLTKYTMVFFYMSALLYLFAERQKRTLLLHPLPWLAVVLSILVFSPILLWNYNHNWVTFLHTAGQAHLGDGLTFRPGSFIEFIGSQLGVVTPVLLVLMLIATVKLKGRDESFSLLFWFSVPVLIFFLLKSLQGKVQANWALPGYISMLVALSFYVTDRWRGFPGYLKATTVAGFLIAISVTFIAHYPGAINLPPRMDPTARLRGWKALGIQVSRIARQLEEPFFIFSDRYQISSELAFYVEGNPVTYCLNAGRRMNQYDLWPGFYNLTGYNAIFVTWGDRALPGVLNDRFRDCGKRLFSVKERGYILREYSIFVCHGFKGMEKPIPGEF